MGRRRKKKSEGLILLLLPSTARDATASLLLRLLLRKKRRRRGKRRRRDRLAPLLHRLQRLTNVVDSAVVSAIFIHELVVSCTAIVIAEELPEEQIRRGAALGRCRLVDMLGRTGG